MNQFSNKKIVFGVLFFIFLGLLFPFQQIKAEGSGPIDWIANAIIKSVEAIFFGILGLTFSFIAAITAIFAGISAAILNWVLSPNFISLSYTNSGLKPGDANFNEIVYIGWTLTRDLVNIVFILVLVFIGISTALRYGGYEMKKTLPTFVLIALLINFTPVFLGLIIDASNIVMNFFLSDLGGGWDLMTTLFQQGARNVQGGVTTLFDSAFFGKSVALASFGATTAIILFLYAILFIARYVVLWILIILSPLAFALYILPKTRSYFERWWKQFIHWCIVGIPAAFFLYLSKQVLYLTSTQCRDEKIIKNCITLGDIGKDQPFGGALDSILPFGIVTIFLYLGLLFGFVSSAEGSAAIIAATKTRGKAAAKAVAEKLRRGVEERTKLPERTERYGRRLSEAKPAGAIGTLEKWTGGGAIRHYVSRSMMGYGERYRGEYSAGLTELEKTTSLNIAAQMDYYPELKKAAALKIIAERGDLKKTKLMDEKGTLNQKLAPIFDTAKTYGKEKDLIKFMPQYGMEVGISVKDALKLSSPADREKFDKVIFEDEDVRKAMVHSDSTQKWSKIGYHGPDVVILMQETLEKEFNSNPRQLIEDNAALLRYSHSSAATTLGMNPIGDLKEIEKRAKFIKMDYNTLQENLNNIKKELAAKPQTAEEFLRLSKEIKILTEEISLREANKISEAFKATMEEAEKPAPPAKKSRGFGGPGTTDYKKPKGGFGGPGTTDYKKPEGGFKGPGTTK